MKGAYNPHLGTVGRRGHNHRQPWGCPAALAQGNDNPKGVTWRGLLLEPHQTIGRSWIPRQVMQNDAKEASGADIQGGRHGVLCVGPGFQCGAGGKKRAKNLCGPVYIVPTGLTGVHGRGGTGYPPSLRCYFTELLADHHCA